MDDRQKKINVNLKTPTHLTQLTQKVPPCNEDHNQFYVQLLHLVLLVLSLAGRFEHLLIVTINAVFSKLYFTYNRKCLKKEEENLWKLINESKSLWKTVKKSRPSLLPSSFSSYSTSWSKLPPSLASVFSSVFVLCTRNICLQHLYL